MTVEMATDNSSGEAEEGMAVCSGFISVSFLRNMFHLSFRGFLSFVTLWTSSGRLKSGVVLGVDMDTVTAEVPPSL